MVLNWLLTQNKEWIRLCVRVLLTRTVHSTTCYAIISGASLFSLNQIFYLLGMLEIAFVVESVLIRLCSSVFTKI